MIQTIQGFFNHKYNYYNTLAGSYKVINLSFYFSLNLFFLST